MRKQQDISGAAPRPPATATKPAQDPLAQINSLADALNTAAGECIQSADPDAVHRVRTFSRRLQATLEAILRERGSVTEAIDRPAAAWLRRLKQIRRAAGPVRDLDVQRKLLQNWIEKRLPKDGGTGGQGEPDGDARRLHKEAQKLDAWLSAERKHLAREMQKKIRKRHHELAEEQSAFFAAVALELRGSPRVSRPADVVALEDFVRAADAMPLLDEENLHDFRKATKKARYVAEAGAHGQKNCMVAKALKRVQDAIGDWHDWMGLTRETKAALGEDSTELSACFERDLERHFVAAMKTTQNMRGQLLGEWMASHKRQVQSFPKRSPVGIRETPFASGF